MKILIAIDGSESCLNAVRYVITLVSKLTSDASTVTLVSVHDDVALRHAKRFVGADAIADYLRELREKELAGARKLLTDAKVDFASEIRTGQVAGEIIKFASQGKFDLVVLGAKGRGSFSDVLLGSVAQRVSATATNPVLLVK